MKEATIEYRMMVGLGVSSAVVARSYELLQPNKNYHMVKRGRELSQAIPDEGISMIREFPEKVSKNDKLDLGIPGFPP